MTYFPTFFGISAMQNMFLPQLSCGYPNYHSQIPIFNTGFFTNLINSVPVSSTKSTINTFGSSSIFGFLTQPAKTCEKVKTAYQEIKIATGAKVKNAIKTVIKSTKKAFQEANFLPRVKAVAKKINCDYRDLLAVMNAESGLNPQAVNRHGGATGLIQFMPKTAEGLGTTADALRNMSAVEQLPYVEKFLMRCKKGAGFAANERLSGADLYSLVFLPGRAKNDVLCRAGERGKNGKLLSFYESNKGTDINKDGKITKDELEQRIAKFRLKEVAVA